MWNKVGRVYNPAGSGATLIESLDKGVYNVEQDRMSGSLFLTRISDDFEFGFKVYGLETDFVDHVVKTYQNTSKNLGILLNGLKGTGKTVTAKVIANKIGLPAIVVGRPFKGLIEFLQEINQPILIFFDEFEKIFDTNDEEDLEILAMMDGALNNPARRIFLLTTNDTSINDNLINRPGRIRYYKNFSNLSRELAQEYLKDNLKDPKMANTILDFMKKSGISTIDILKTLAEEVNIHGKLEEDFLNVLIKPLSYSVRYLDRGRLLPDDLEGGISRVAILDKIKTIKDIPLDEAELEERFIEESSYSFVVNPHPLSELEPGMVFDPDEEDESSWYILDIDKKRKLILCSNGYGTKALFSINKVTEGNPWTKAY